MALVNLKLFIGLEKSTAIIHHSDFGGNFPSRSGLELVDRNSVAIVRFCFPNLAVSRMQKQSLRMTDRPTPRCMQVDRLLKVEILDLMPARS